LRELVQELLDNQTSVEVDLRKWVQDKSVPLAERWEVFKMSGLGETGDWCYHGFDAIIGEDYFSYDGEYHCERYQTVCMPEVVERAEEDADCLRDENGEYLTDEDGYYIPTDEEKEKLDVMKEQILSDFIRSFKYDW